MELKLIGTERRRQGLSSGAYMQSVSNVDECVENDVDSQKAFGKDQPPDRRVVQCALEPLTGMRMRSILWQTDDVSGQTAHAL